MASPLAFRSFTQEWDNLVTYLSEQATHMTSTQWIIVCILSVVMGFMFLRSGGARA